jgi:hypothetical protein
MTAPERTRIWCPNDLGVLDHADGICHDCPSSWDPRRADTHPWVTPDPRWPLPIFLLACAIAGVLLAGLLLLGQNAVCAIHEGQHPICPDYRPATTEETP